MKYAPDLTARQIGDRIHDRLKSEVAVFLGKPYGDSVTEMLEQHILQNPPSDWKTVNLRLTRDQARDFASRRWELGQVVRLPSTWADKVPFGRGSFLITEYGLIFKGALFETPNSANPQKSENKVWIAFHSEGDLRKQFTKSTNCAVVLNSMQSRK